LKMKEILCRSSYGCLGINLLGTTLCIQFVLNSFPHIITYPPWVSTSYSYTFFISLMRTYHWWFGYPLALVSANAKMNTLQPMIFFGTLSQLWFWKLEHMYGKRFLTSSPIALDNESIFLSPKTTFEL
jgi:hypothetical protein